MLREKEARALNRYKMQLCLVSRAKKESQTLIHHFSIYTICFPYSDIMRQRSVVRWEYSMSREKKLGHQMGIRCSFVQLVGNTYTDTYIPFFNSYNLLPPRRYNLLTVLIICRLGRFSLFQFHSSQCYQAAKCFSYVLVCVAYVYRGFSFPTSRYLFNHLSARHPLSRHLEEFISPLIRGFYIFWYHLPPHFIVSSQQFSQRPT